MQNSGLVTYRALPCRWVSPYVSRSPFPAQD